MQAKNWLNISLLAILALLLTIVFWPQDKISAPKKATIGNGLNSESINNITITRQGYPEIKLHKKEQQWWLEQPPLQAKSRLVQELLAFLKSESLIHYPLSKIEVTQVGLDVPSLCITYEQQRLCFGDRNPLNQLRYLQFGNDIHMIYDTLSHQLSGLPHDYVSLRLLPANSTITALTLVDNVMLKKSGTNWLVTPRPEHYLAEQTQQLLTHWQQAQALMVAPYQPIESEATLQVTLQQQGVIQFELVSSDPELILARPELGIQYHLSEGSLNRLTRLSEGE